MLASQRSTISHLFILFKFKFSQINGRRPVERCASFGFVVVVVVATAAAVVVNCTKSAIIHLSLSYTDRPNGWRALKINVLGSYFMFLMFELYPSHLIATTIHQQIGKSAVLVFWSRLNESKFYSKWHTYRWYRKMYIQIKWVIIESNRWLNGALHLVNSIVALSSHYQSSVLWIYILTIFSFHCIYSSKIIILFMKCVRVLTCVCGRRFSALSNSPWTSFCCCCRCRCMLHIRIFQF